MGTLTMRMMQSAMALLLAMLAGTGSARAAEVLTYHGSPNRSGAYTVSNLTWSKAVNVARDSGFVATVSGSVYAQPLFWVPPGGSTGYIIVATEANNVYALNATSGAQIWKQALGTPGISSELPCGDISPQMGITGTPVIDPTTGTLYVGAMVQTTQGPRHEVFGLSAQTGAILTGWPIEVQSALQPLKFSFPASHQGQRGALAFFDGRLFVPYGGLDGDCKSYKGWVVGFNVTPSPSISNAWATRAQHGGIWGQGGIAVTPSWMFVTTGNTTGVTSWSDGEAVIRLDATLNHHNNNTNYYFTPSNWHDLDDGDTDLGGSGPLPINVPVAGGSPQSDIIQFGKDGNAYLVSRNQLGGIGGQIFVAQVSTGAIRTAGATYSTSTAAIIGFEGDGSNCPTTQSGNMVALSVATGSGTPITTLWCQSYSGNGSPIVTTTDGHSNPIFWVVGANGDNKLHAFRGDTGAPIPISNNPTMNGLHYWQTLIYAAGRFYVGADNTVYAFKF